MSFNSRKKMTIKRQKTEGMRSVDSVPSGQFVCMPSLTGAKQQHDLQTYCDTNKNWSVNHSGSINQGLVNICCIKK